MSTRKSVRVEAYSGTRADERPLRFKIDGRWTEVIGVTARVREPDAEQFDVETPAGRTRLRHDLRTDEWTAETL